MISFTVKDDSRFWQAIVNALICFFVWQATSFDTEFSKALFILSAVSTALVMKCVDFRLKKAQGRMHLAFG